MKYTIIFFLSTFFLVNIHAQVWTYSQGKDAFDGAYKTCSITGVGYEFPYTSPVFVINVFNKQITKPNVYLTNVPSGVCDNNRVLIKFDDDDKIYEPEVSTSNDHNVWFLHITNTTGMGMREVTDSIKKSIKFYIIPSFKPLKIRNYPDANSKPIIGLSSKDTIDIIYLDAPYWVCRYKNQIVYMHEMYLSGVQKYPSERDEEVYLPYKRMEEIEYQTDDELNPFFEDVKSHSVMHVRLVSDCIQSDFKFSLKGSSAALNFVFSK